MGRRLDKEMALCTLAEWLQKMDIRRRIQAGANGYRRWTYVVGYKQERMATEDGHTSSDTSGSEWLQKMDIRRRIQAGANA